jgi:hypothetical protein
MSGNGSSDNPPMWPSYIGGTIVDGTVMWFLQGIKVYQPVINYGDDAMLNMQGEPITQSVKAKEATPKYEPPLIEEREV